MEPKFNNDKKEKIIQNVANTASVVVKSAIITRIVMLCMILIPFIVIIATFTVVANKLMGLNTAITIVKVLFSVLAVFNIGLFIFDKIKKNYKRMTIDIIFLILGIFYVGMIVYTSCFMPVKLVHYATKEYITIEETKIPTLYK